MTVRRPHPTVIANALTAAAATSRNDGDRARRLATLLASRGYPTARLGGGSRSSDTTTSTERAALNPDQWAGIDDQLARLERLLWATAEKYMNLASRILAQACDDDPIPAGTGTCLRCEKFCRPDDRQPENRIRAGYCPACYRQWLRLGRPDRPTFTRTRDEDEVVIALFPHPGLVTRHDLG